MASITKRNNKYTANVSLTINGTRKRITKSGFNTKAEAQNWATKQELKKSAGNTFSSITLPEYFNDWYLNYKESQIAEATKVWYKRTYGVLLEYLNKPLNKINRNEFQQFLNQYGSTRSKASLKKVRGQVREMIKYAIDDHIIENDFTAGTVFNYSVEEKKPELKYLETDEMSKLIDYLNAQNNALPTRMIILTALYTGARFSELAGLQWSDIHNGYIDINKSWYEPDKILKDTKNPQSIRKVDLKPEIIKQIKSMPHISDFVFANDDLYPVTHNGANKYLKHAEQVLGIKQITFHGLRHTHASYLIQNDILINYVAERLGHKDVTVTLEVYAHLLKERRNDEINKTLALKF